MRTTPLAADGRESENYLFEFGKVCDVLNACLWFQSDKLKVHGAIDDISRLMAMLAILLACPFNPDQAAIKLIVEWRLATARYRLTVQGLLVLQRTQALGELSKLRGVRINRLQNLRRMSVRRAQITS